MQLQRSHTHSNTPSSNIHTTSWLTTQPVSTMNMHLALMFHTLYNNPFTTQRTPSPHAGQIVTTPFSPSNHTHLPPHTYNLVVCDPTSVDPLRYAPFRHESPIPISPTHNTYRLILVSQARRSPHIRIPLTIHTTLFSATQPQSPHIHPLQSKYIQSLSRVPSASISPHTLYPKEGRNKRSCARNLMVIGATDASMSGNLL